MTLKEFEDKLQEIRARNSWEIHLECRGLWIITILDKESGKKLASTGSTGLYGILQCLEMPFNAPPWTR